jgi:hypothetical protein
MHYRLTLPGNPHTAAVLKSTIAALSGDNQMQKDRERLTRACYGPKSLEAILGAPFRKERRTAQLIHAGK